MTVATDDAGAEDGDAGVDADEPAVDSRWWYWIVLTPVFAATLLLFVLGFSATVLIGSATDVSVFLPAFFVLALMAVVFGTTFPVALYADATAVGASTSAWDPDGARYAAAGAVGVLGGFVLTIPIGAYYLHRRRERVGIP